MNYYQELTILPDPDINMYFIWQKLYTQLHIALADLYNQHGIDTVGISFPNYKYEAKADKNGNVREFATLGNKLRIFAPTEDALTKLDIKTWLERLTDYVHIKSTQAVGDKPTGYVVVKRHRYINKQKQAEDFAVFKDIGLDEALKHCQTYKRSNAHYPFINLNSQSNGHCYKLSICQTIVNKEHNGSFNLYGINNNTKNTTVPHW